MKMAVHLIIDIRVYDKEKFKAYAKRVQSTVKKFGGQYLCKWGNPEILEGEWNTNRIVIVQFETADKAKEWWDSDEYRPLKSLRREASNTRVMLVDTK
jgi:uncharacterized protein (DUF1330 family)